MKMIGSMLMAMLLVSGCGDDVGESRSSVVSADKGGNSDCTVCCKALFPPGKDRGQCISEAAHHMGVCWCATQCCVLDMSVALPDLSTPARDLAASHD